MYRTTQVSMSLVKSFYRQPYHRARSSHLLLARVPFATYQLSSPSARIPAFERMLLSFLFSCKDSGDCLPPNVWLSTYIPRYLESRDTSHQGTGFSLVFFNQFCVQTFNTLGLVKLKLVPLDRSAFAILLPLFFSILDPAIIRRTVSSMPSCYG